MSIPMAAQASGAASAAIGSGTPSDTTRTSAMKAPAMMVSRWARLMVFITPNTRLKPIPTSAYVQPYIAPFRICCRRNSIRACRQADAAPAAGSRLPDVKLAVLDHEHHALLDRIVGGRAHVDVADQSAEALDAAQGLAHFPAVGLDAFLRVLDAGLLDGVLDEIDRLVGVGAELVHLHTCNLPEFRAHCRGARLRAVIGADHPHALDRCSPRLDQLLRDHAACPDELWAEPLALRLDHGFCANVVAAEEDQHVGFEPDE